MDGNFENATIRAKSERAKEILTEIELVDLAIEKSKIKLTCPVLGAGKHNKEDYEKRKFVMNTIKNLGHNSFFPEEITTEDAKIFLRESNTNLKEMLIESLVGNEERKNDAILKCSKIIFAVATNEGVLIEIGKCCTNSNIEKLRVFVPENKHNELSQASMTLDEIGRLYGNVYTFSDDNDLKTQLEVLLKNELAKIFRNN